MRLGCGIMKKIALISAFNIGFVTECYNEMFKNSTIFNQLYCSIIA